jgi:outer membrane protein OmpA-like peptidoglycan-associated protein
MKAVNFLSGILKAAILLIFFTNLTFAQQGLSGGNKKKSLKRVYDCRKVGVQKVKSGKVRAAKNPNVVSKLESENKIVIPDTIVLAGEKREEMHAKVISSEVEKVEEEIQKIYVLPLPKPVYFKFDSDELSFEDLYQIALAVEHLRMGKSIILEGHTDSFGSNAYNMALSQRRALKIKKMIMEAGGVDESAISIRYYGEEKPAVENSSAENRQLNRRVEFIVL